jgi:aspartate--ammonia ligase
MLKLKHIGEVQVSIWDPKKKEELLDQGVELL